MKPYLLLGLLFISQISLAQSKLIDKTIAKIEFETDTIQSVFDWITDNIKYDVAKYNSIVKSSRSSNKSNMSREEYYQLSIKEVIRKKKGVCQDYSLLFDAILSKLGYETQIIEGYTKDEKGKIQRIGHTWNAIKIDGKWKLYDPTWGAGYVNDRNKFIKKYNAEWYDVSVKEMFKRHMPFDPMWQLLNNPITYQAFKEGGIISDLTYDMDDQITAHFKMEKEDQMKAQLKRSKDLGSPNKVIKSWQKILETNISYSSMNSQAKVLRETDAKSKATVDVFNKYGSAKVYKFQKEPWNIEYSEKTLLELQTNTISLIETYQNAKPINSKMKRSLKERVKSLEGLLNKINNELEFQNSSNKCNFLKQS